MLGIPNGSRLDNALKTNRGTLTNAREKQLQDAQTKTTVRNDPFAKKPAVVTGIDYKTGKKRVIRIRSKLLQKTLRIDPDGVETKEVEAKKETKAAKAKSAEMPPKSK